MNHGLSDQVRSVALDEYIRPAIQTGKLHFSVAVRDLMPILQKNGFPKGNWPQVCSAIQTGRFLRENGLEIDRVDGPPKKQSPTVIVHYRLARSNGPTGELGNVHGGAQGRPLSETPEERAYRLTERLRGLMKNEIAAHGGASGYIRWVRGYDEEGA
jgi:hypothetical protein